MKAGCRRAIFYPQWKGNPPIEGAQGEYLTDRLTDEAVKFIRTNREQPFFLYLPHYAVHVPIEAKEELVRKYRAKLKPGQLQNDPIYAAMIQSMDESVGRILGALADAGITDRTVVIFTSDNGGLSAPEWKLKPVTSNSPLREGKGPRLRRRYSRASDRKLAGREVPGRRDTRLQHRSSPDTCGSGRRFRIEL